MNPMNFFKSLILLNLPGSSEILRIFTIGNANEKYFAKTIKVETLNEATQRNKKFQEAGKVQ